MSPLVSVCRANKCLNYHNDVFNEVGKARQKVDWMLRKTHNDDNVTITLASQCSPTYEFELPWPKVLGNHATKHTRSGSHYKVAEAVAYDVLVSQIVAQMGMGNLTGQTPLAGPLSVSWLLAPPDARARDVDNVRKVVADALTKAGFWKDDSCKVLVREAFEWTKPMRGGAIGLTVGVLA